MREILVKFKSRQNVIKYTMEIFYLLITDKDIEYIVDANTGELLFNNEGYINRKEVYGI